MDYQKIAQILIEKIKAEYAEDIAAVVSCPAKDQPDVSAGLYLITKTERGKALGRAFLVREHSVHIPCYSYTELAELGTYDRKEVYRLLDGQLLYVKSTEDAGIFEAIRQKTADCDKIELMLVRLLYDCKELYFTFYENEADAAAIAIQILKKISCALLMYNGSYLKSGWDGMKEEVLSLAYLPECYALAIDQVSKTADPAVLKNLCRKLMMQTSELILPKKAKQNELLPAEQVYAGVYEQAKVYYEKITQACFAKKASVALLYATDLQQMFDRLAQTADKAPSLKNLLDLYYSKDLASFAVSLYSHEASLIGFLVNLGMEFEQYPNMERFAQAMSGKKEEAFSQG